MIERLKIAAVALILAVAAAGLGAASADAAPAAPKSTTSHRTADLKRTALTRHGHKIHLARTIHHRRTAKAMAGKVVTGKATHEARTKTHRQHLAANHHGAKPTTVVR